MSVHRRWFSLPREPATVAAGRRRVRALITAWGGAPLDEDTRLTVDLVTSELLGNAVRHATGRAVTVGVHADPLHHRAVIEVYDASPALPIAGRPDQDSESGRGILLIAELALAHGVIRKRWGKWVWAEIALPAPPDRTRERPAPRSGVAAPDGPVTVRAKNYCATVGRLAVRLVGTLTTSSKESLPGPNSLPAMARLLPPLTTCQTVGLSGERSMVPLLGAAMLTAQPSQVLGTPSSGFLS
ncbi:ATP-binding protein [Kitasatospora sp. NPDC092948]|uniref:ATP-binding protein n=1 Tax=Kitasatospora sp. NPDC092948 TaxID=3364088 RepID=UPI0038151DC6